MKIREAMNNNIYSIESYEYVGEALKKMYDLGIQRLFVFDDDDKAVGIITYRDILLLSGSDETMINIDMVLVSDIMTEHVISIDADESIQNAANLILRAEISGLLVTENDKCVGVITKTDICRVVSMYSPSKMNENE